jgi:pimeloyl-ACP methyl ester carboxylesterase
MGLLSIVVTAGAALIVVWLIWAEALQQRKDRSVPPPGRLVDVGGRHLHVLAKGEGPAVVLIAGGGEPGGFLSPLQDRLATFTRVCTYDRPGFGWSQPSPSPMSFEAHARDLRAMLGEAGEHGPYVIVAESLGGLIARTFARLFPTEVAGLVLVDAAEEEHIFSRMHVLKAAARQQMILVRILRPLGLVRRAVHRALGRRYDPKTRRDLAAALSRATHWDAAMQEIEAYQLTRASDRQAGGFGGFKGPLTVIAHGRPFQGPNAALEDGWRAGQERLRKLSPTAKFIVAEKAGHTIAQEDPGLVAEEVRQLLLAIELTSRPPRKS